MNDDLLTRLAGANPVVADMPPLDVDIEQLKRRPLPQTGLRTRPGPHRHLRGLAAGVTTIAVGCGIGLVVARVPSHDAGGARPQARSVPAPQVHFVTISRVLSVFRAPSVAYRAACHGAHQLDLCTLRVEGSRVRSVAIGDGYTAVIDPVHVSRSTELAHRGQAIVLALHGPQRGPMNMTPPATLRTVRDRGLLVSTFTHLGANQGAILVPNGVAAITLTQLHVDGVRAPDAGSAVEVATTKVAHNISVFRMTGLTRRALMPRTAALKRYYISSVAQGCHTKQAVYALPATAEMSWRSASGTLIRHTPIALRVKLGITNPPQSTVPQPPHCR